MDKEKFELLVEMALKSLPEEFLERLDNVEVLVADQPTYSQLRKAGLKSNETLLGIYEGVPRTRRDSNYGMVLPDKITVFQKTIEAKCHSENEVIVEIERVVKHEIAHHFGIDDERLRELGKY